MAFNISPVSFKDKEDAFIVWCTHSMVQVWFWVMFKGKLAPISAFTMIINFAFWYPELENGSRDINGQRHSINLHLVFNCNISLHTGNVQSLSVFLRWRSLLPRIDSYQSFSLKIQIYFTSFCKLSNFLKVKVIYNNELHVGISIKILRWQVYG